MVSLVCIRLRLKASNTSRMWIKIEEQQVPFPRISLIELRGIWNKLKEQPAPFPRILNMLRGICRIKLEEQPMPFPKILIMLRGLWFPLHNQPSQMQRNWINIRTHCMVREVMHKLHTIM
jgi:hypothetical protein